MEFAFISVDRRGATQATQKTVVRSRCMRGANKKPDSRRSRQAIRKDRGRAIADTQSVTKANRRSNADKSNTGKSASISAWADDPDQSMDEQTRIKLLLSRSIDIIDISKRSLSASDFLSDRSLIPLACCEDPGSRELLTKYAWFKRRMYPVEACVDFAMDEGCWADCFAYDAGFVHAVLFTGAAIEDFVLRRNFSRATSLHLQQTIKRLKLVVGKGSSAVTPATFTIVLSLCMVASIYADGDALAIHLAALQHMAHMCGRDTHLLLEPMIQFKLEALELASFMCTGPTPKLGGSVSWSPIYLPADPRTMHNNTPGYNAAIEGCYDRRMRHVYKDLRALCDQLNACFSSAERLQGTTFQATVSSLQTRLMHLEGDLPNSLQECIRLGMIAFLSTNIRVPTRRLHCAYLRAKLIEVSESLTPISLGEIEVRLWVLTITAMSIFEPYEEWMVGQWRQYAPAQLTWSDLKGIVKGVHWVDCMHDELGKETFEALHRAATDKSE